ncbi:MAG: putative Ig domain-containing protein, partial [Desulfobacterales bacterium]|nr:putative Ig domain-containing protein [Desulfobacterales bacterium]
ITVTDDGIGNLSDSKTFTITVGEVNTAPVLDAIGDQSVNEHDALTFTAAATDPDNPADGLTYSLDAASIASGMTINATTGEFSWTPGELQQGNHTVTITVTDDGTGNLSDSETFTITVNDINSPPILATLEDKTVEEFSTLTFKASATDPNQPGDTLSYALDPAATALGMSIDPATGQFSWTPGEGLQGSYTITLTVTDSGTGHLTSSQVFTITVTASPNSGSTPEPEPSQPLPPDTGDTPLNNIQELPTGTDGNPITTPDTPISNTIHSTTNTSQEASEETAPDELGYEILFLDQDLWKDQEPEDGAASFSQKAFTYFDNTLYRSPGDDAVSTVTPTSDLPVTLTRSKEKIDLDVPVAEDMITVHDELREELDESFTHRLKTQSITTRIAAISTVTFTAGVVTNLLKTGSLLASLSSSIPLWRFFDPVAVFSGKSKKNSKPPGESTETETLFDGAKHED